LFFVSAMLAAGVMLTFNKQFAPEAKAPTNCTTVGLAIWLVIGLTALNAASALLECGFSGCPGNPVR
jgi:hypothetical protein